MPLIEKLLLTAILLPAGAIFIRCFVDKVSSELASTKPEILVELRQYRSDSEGDRTEW